METAPDFQRSKLFSDKGRWAEWNEWFLKVMAFWGNNNFRSVHQGLFKNHAPYNPSITSGPVRPMLSAEAFNSKVKIFRSQMRGVRDRDFFIFRLVKLYA